MCTCLQCLDLFYSLLALSHEAIKRRMFPFHYNSNKNVKNEATKIPHYITGHFLVLSLKVVNIRPSHQIKDHRVSETNLSLNLTFKCDYYHKNIKVKKGKHNLLMPTCFLIDNCSVTFIFYASIKKTLFSIRL